MSEKTYELGTLIDIGGALHILMGDAADCVYLRRVSDGRAWRQARMYRPFTDTYLNNYIGSVPWTIVYEAG